MISVDEALDIIDRNRPDWGIIDVPLGESCGQVLAQNITAKFTQPSAAMSVMDGYALRKADIKTTLNIIGESRAGHPFSDEIKQGEAVRIFTGAILPQGADYVEIQEHATRIDNQLTFHTLSKNRHYIRDAGADFSEGDILFKEGTKITPAIILSFATNNMASVSVYKTPVIGLLRGGDELRPVGEALTQSTIIDSIGPALMALLTQWGLRVIDLGIAEDSLEDITAKVENCSADVIVTIGGASVGKYDFMQRAFADLNFAALFSKVAVKPGKPTWFSKRGDQCVLGLPGNPSSAWVCAHWKTYELSVEISPNGGRETFLRGCSSPEGLVAPLSKQDSGLTLPLTKTDILIRRAIFADKAPIGTHIECLDISNSTLKIRKLMGS